MTSARHPSNIGPYQIQRELGRGGMGEVFLARDTRLDRPVAIKALPAHLAQDPDRLARFQREAKVLASLNHPSIGAIYGLEEADGHQYLILEYVEGQTLADRLSQGPIPLDEALACAKQIAEALEAAHEKGVIHRDLKPGNVMVTPDGAVKVLDFGLARTADGAVSSSNASAPADSPTVTSPARFAHSPTIPGVIMGTAGYMSPEQARGKPVDKRSDIFSFGCVLYEMLTGIMPFRGETVADAIGATLHKESDLSLLPARTPRRVRDLLTNCLAKDKRNRLHDIGDARLELQRAITEPTEVAQSAVAPSARWRWTSVLAALAILTLIAVIVLRPSRQVALSSGTILRAAVGFPKGMTLPEGSRPLAVSPDGTQVVMALLAKGGVTSTSLYLRDLSRLEYRALAGTEEATYPFWSPDGRSIAFFAARQLKRIDLKDGIVRVICDAPVGRGGSWGTKGTIVFAPSAGGGLWGVSDAGGVATPITTAATSSESHRMPHMLPDGQRFLYYVQNTSADGIYAFDPATKQSRLVISGMTEAFYVEPGMLVFARDENLMAQPFDLKRLELTGTAQPIAAGVQYDKARGYINAGLSSQGTLIYQIVNPPARARLGWMDRTGERTILPVEPLAITFQGATMSADGHRAAVSIGGARSEVSPSVIDLERGIRTPLGDPTRFDSYGALWGPGDQSVIATEVRSGRQNITSFPVSGEPPTNIIEGEPGFEYGATSISPDGRTLLYVQVPLRDKLGDIMTISLDKSTQQQPQRFMQTPEGEWNPTFSPTGDIVAYTVSGEDDGGSVLKLVTYPTPSAPVQVTASPVVPLSLWLKPDELFWIDLSDRAWSASIRAKDGRIDVGAHKPMFAGRPLDKQVRIVGYDLPRERFLIAIQDEPRDDPRIIIVSDWRPDAAGPKPAAK